MFTGIVEAVGTLDRVEDLGPTRRFHVVAPWASELADGDSVAVDGACLTVVERTGETGFWVDVIGTTLQRTIAGGYRPGARVNLERALRMGDGLDGHLVQGHIDGIGYMIQSVRDGEFWLMDFRIPEAVARQTVERGSIALNGVSLTVAEMPEPEVCRIGVIPFTHARTNLGTVQPGDAVNVEGDLIGKYVGRMLAPRQSRP